MGEYQTNEDQNKKPEGVFMTSEGDIPFPLKSNGKIHQQNLSVPSIFAVSFLQSITFKSKMLKIQ